MVRRFRLTKSIIANLEAQWAERPKSELDPTHEEVIRWQSDSCITVSLESVATPPT